MKKLTERRRKWLANRQKTVSTKNKSQPKRFRARNRLSRPQSHLVKCWTADGILTARARHSNVPPKRLCYDTNRDKTFEFLKGWCKGLQISKLNSGETPRWITPAKNSRSMARINSYVDFSKLEYISTAVALVMTAAYDRVATITGYNPPAVNLDEWNTDVITKLFEIGFFENVGLIENPAELFNTSGNIKTLKITSGNNATELEEVCRKIMQLLDFLDVTDDVIQAKMFELNTALSEAMSNVAKHAYPDDHDFEHRHVDKWWVTAAVDRSKTTLNVAIFDQGATIPVTFPHKRVITHISDGIAEIGSTFSGNEQLEYGSDGTYIHEAMLPGMTQTKEKHRGKGLPEMKETIDTLGNASMTIYSRCGICKYDHNGFEYQSQQHSVGGTLIEWTLRFDGKN